MLARVARRMALLAAVVCTPALAARAQPRGRPLTIEDYYRIASIGAVTLSPDARSVAFTVSTRIEETNGTTSELWVVPTDGSAAPRRVEARDTEDWMPGAGGGRGGRGGGSAGGGGRGAGRGGGSGAGIASPDGRFVARIRDVPPPARTPAAMTDFERRHEERFKGVQFDWLNFQRDGGAFPVPNSSDPYVSPPQELFLIPASGGPERQLTRLGLRPTSVSWYRDGSALIFVGDSTYRDERAYGADQVFEARTDGTVRRLTTSNSHNHTGASVSPDGRWILFTRQLSTDAVIAQKLNHGGARDLVVMPAGGGPERNLTEEWDYLPGGVRWSPDARYVYFTGAVGGTEHLFRVAPTGGPVQQLTQGERRIGGIAFDSAMTMMVYTVGRIEGPPEIHAARIDGSNERQLTRVHEPFTREVALSRAERLRFPSKDGTMVEAWLLYPYGYRADGGPYPLVVDNHGGPHANVGYSFSFKNQVFAANGYFVLSVNFRGSTGYGERFLWGSWGAWGDRDGEDVMAGVDHAMGRYPIDRARVATMGHSYGGFMSNWLITQYPDRFAAAAVGAGISNWVSDYGTADIARTKETEFYGTPWDDRGRETMIRQSPLTYAGRARAATLFIHGEVDQRVPYEEAEQMYVALKKNGVPAKMIQYEGQSHGISGSWNTVHRMINELRWFDTYLKPGRAQ